MQIALLIAVIIVGIWSTIVLVIDIKQVSKVNKRLDEIQKDYKEIKECIK